MQPQILNVDILDDKEPHILVQKYIFPDRTFQVFRKPTSPDERFEVSPGIKIDPDLYWHVPFTLTMTPDDLNYTDDDFDDADAGSDADAGDEDEDDDALHELFAVVCLDEENPPTYDPDESSDDGMEYLNIAYDPQAQLYCCEPALVAHERLERITATTLDEALALGIDTLRTLLAAETATE